jgi:hypothetical protein
MKKSELLSDYSQARRKDTRRKNNFKKEKPFEVMLFAQDSSKRREHFCRALSH